tara:strand:+ start:3438 stop:3683 length:246 start_codon:yes stop_codon:yes gene_type:complete
MDIKQAIGVLETHNRWRRREDLEPMLKPRDIGIAIDIVVEHVKNNVVSDDIIKCDCELERHERAKIELDYNKCMDCKKQIQ